jgi:hypothetical protein
MSLVAQSSEGGMVDSSWTLAALARRGQSGSTDKAQWRVRSGRLAATGALQDANAFPR